MDIKKLADVKDRFADYEKIFNSGDYDKAADILSAILERIEECTDERKAGTMDDTFVKKSDMDGRPIYISLNHVMEYYVYACYFEPETDVLCTELPVGEYYRTYGSLCLKLSKFRRAEDAFKKAICWNPVDLDSYLGLAECYKNLNMLSRYLDVTKQAYRFCCSRATMARYYRNMGFYYVARYNTEAARVCYTYSNIYYKTDNADNELKYLEQALNDKTPEYSVKQMQEILDENEVEPGPDSKIILSRHEEIHRAPIVETDLNDCMGLPMYDIAAKLFPQEQEQVRNALMDELCTFENGYLAERGGILYPQLAETLYTLSKKYPLYIVSNCQDGYIESFLTAHLMSDFFKDTECWGRTFLPKSESNKILIERNGLKNPVYVGDTSGDAKSAKDAGIDFIYAEYGFGEVSDDRYVAKIESFAELSAIL